MKHALSKTIIVSKVTELIASKYKISLQEALDKFYSSKISTMLSDDETCLYGESPLYVFSLYEQYSSK